MFSVFIYPYFLIVHFSVSHGIIGRARVLYILRIVLDCLISKSSKMIRSMCSYDFGSEFQSRCGKSTVVVIFYLSPGFFHFSIFSKTPKFSLILFNLSFILFFLSSYNSWFGKRMIMINTTFVCLVMASKNEYLKFFWNSGTEVKSQNGVREIWLSYY